MSCRRPGHGGAGRFPGQRWHSAHRAFHHLSRAFPWCRFLEAAELEDSGLKGPYLVAMA